MHAYGLLVGGKCLSSFSVMALLKWMESRRRQLMPSCQGLSEAYVTAVRLNPTEVIEMARVVTSEEVWNVNLHATEV